LFDTAARELGPVVGLVGGRSGGEGAEPRSRPGSRRVADGSLFLHIWATVYETMMGFIFGAVGGVVLGIWLGVAPFTNRVAYLEEGDYVAIDHGRALIFDASGESVERPIPRRRATSVMRPR